MSTRSALALEKSNAVSYKCVSESEEDSEDETESEEDSENETESEEDSEKDQEKDQENEMGLSLEKLNLGRRKKLLVMSLGGVLLHRAFRFKDASIPKQKRHDCVLGSHLVYRRPYCEDFMKYCFQRFEVAIWSSARERNVDHALDFVMGGLRNKLVFVWDQDECIDSGFQTLENNNKPLFLKRLKKIWENFGKHYSASNTLLIDATPYTAILNPPNTAIFPSPFNPDNYNDTDLGPSGGLRLYLDGLEDAADVSSFVEQHPFGQPAISSTSAHWDFYSRIIQRFRRD